MLLVDAPAEVVSLIRTVVSNSWTAGIQRESEERHGVFRLTLCGKPFSRYCTRDVSVRTKKMLCLILKTLREHGWQLTLSSDLDRTYDLLTLFFQKVSFDGYDGCNIMCLSLSAHDKLQLVNAPSDAGRIIIECVADLYQKHIHADEFFEVQMKDYLWSAITSESGFRARQLLLDIFHRFHEVRYRYYGTANIKGTADCIFFITDCQDVGPREYCMISLNANDRMRIIGAPDELIGMVGECIQRHWPKGIQDAEKKGDGAYFEYKMKGFPWSSCGIASVDSRLVLTVILQQLITVGWGVVTALDVSRRANDKAVFVLRRCAVGSVPHFAICPAEADKIRVINADKQMIELVGNVLRSSWTLGIQRQGLYGHSFEYKLAGHMWSSWGFGYSGQFVLCRMMMTRLLYELAQRGWRVICSADVSSKYNTSDNDSYQHSVDVHSWFVAYTGLASDAQPTLPNPTLRAPEQVVQTASPLEPPPCYNEAVAGVGVLPPRKN